MRIVKSLQKCRKWAQRAVQGRSLQGGGRMKSKPVAIGVSERISYHSPKRRRVSHLIESQPSSSSDWLANGRYNESCASSSYPRIPYHFESKHQLPNTLLRRAGPCWVTHECPMLSDGAIYRRVIGLRRFVHLLRHARSPSAAGF